LRGWAPGQGAMEAPPDQCVLSGECPSCAQEWDAAFTRLSPRTRCRLLRRALSAGTRGRADVMMFCSMGSHLSAAPVVRAASGCLHAPSLRAHRRRHGCGRAAASAEERQHRQARAQVRALPSCGCLPRACFCHRAVRTPDSRVLHAEAGGDCPGPRSWPPRCLRRSAWSLRL